MLLSAVLISAGMRFYTPPDKYISVEQLLKAGNLTAQIKSKGGHKGDCVEFDIKNMTPDTLFVHLEAGRILVPEDSSMQDIFLAKNIRIDLEPYKTKKFTAFGFCCKSSKSSPAKDIKFDIGKMAPPEWLKLAEIIDKNDFPLSSIQSAVWAVSDNHPVSSIYDENNIEILELRRTVSEIRGEEIPWYSLIFEEDTNSLFSHIPERLVGELDYYIRNNAVVTINIRNKNGQIVTYLVDDVVVNPGNYTYDLDLNVKGWPRGEYDVYVYTDFSNVNIKKTFKL